VAKLEQSFRSTPPSSSFLTDQLDREDEEEEREARHCAEAAKARFTDSEAHQLHHPVTKQRSCTMLCVFVLFEDIHQRTPVMGRGGAPLEVCLGSWAIGRYPTPDPCLGFRGLPFCLSDLGVLAGEPERSPGSPASSACFLAIALAIWRTGSRPHCADALRPE
jgi:hypothetical protein